MGKVRICITVDWEGDHLRDVDDLLWLRQEFGQEVPFTHFICPNYFINEPNEGAGDGLSTLPDKQHSVTDQPLTAHCSTTEGNLTRGIPTTTQLKGGGERKSGYRAYNSESIKEALLKVDEVGLHVHCFREMMQAFDIPFREDENYHNLPGWFERTVLQRVYPGYGRKVTGRGVPLSVYSPAEIEKIIQLSRELLKAALNLEEIRGFRAGGWIANDVVLEKVSNLGFTYDSSAVPPALFFRDFGENASKGQQKNPVINRDDYGDGNGRFAEHIVKLWGFQEQPEGFLQNRLILEGQQGEAVTSSTQPYFINGLQEIPNNCALADFSSPEKTVLPQLRNYLTQMEEDPDKDFVLVYGCHQEGDVRYKEELHHFIREVQRMNEPSIEFTTLGALVQGK